MKIAITSGYFNPIHPGHIECFRMAKESTGADHLCVIVNNDEQALLKRGVKSFQNQDDRMKIVESIRWVDKVVLSIDNNATVCKTLEHMIRYYNNNLLTSDIFFAKGGDRFSDNTPEKLICDRYGIKLIDGLGKKTHNSSDYLKRT